MYFMQFRVNLQGVFLTGPPLKMSLEPELIFVTNITNYNRGEKTVKWRNFNFLYRIRTIYGVSSKFMSFLFRISAENICMEKK